MKSKQEILEKHLEECNSNPTNYLGSPYLNAMEEYATIKAQNFLQPDVSGNSALGVAVAFADWINFNQWEGSQTDEHGWQRIVDVSKAGVVKYEYAETNLLFEMFNGKSN